MRTGTSTGDGAAALMPFLSSTRLKQICAELVRKIDSSDASNGKDSMFFSSILVHSGSCLSLSVKFMFISIARRVNPLFAIN